MNRAEALEQLRRTAEVMREERDEAQSSLDRWTGRSIAIGFVGGLGGLVLGNAETAKIVASVASLATGVVSTWMQHKDFGESATDSEKCVTAAEAAELSFVRDWGAGAHPRTEEEVEEYEADREEALQKVIDAC